MFVFLLLMLSASENSVRQISGFVLLLMFTLTYAHVAGVLTCLCLCCAYACDYAYALVRTKLQLSAAYWQTFYPLYYHRPMNL